VANLPYFINSYFYVSVSASIFSVATWYISSRHQHVEGNDIKSRYKIGIDGYYFQGVVCEEVVGAA
jgi:hypothetical protein